IEQIDPNLESAARVFGARTASVFLHVLVPLLAPGILAASLLVLVRTIAMFELTFLTAGADSQTLVVALYYAVFAAGVRAPQSVDAMAMVYMVVTLVWLLIALRFVNPPQLVSRGRVHPQPAYPNCSYRWPPSPPRGSLAAPPPGGRRLPYAPPAMPFQSIEPRRLYRQI